MRWEEEAVADGVSGLRGRSLERPAFRVPRHPPWFQVVGNSGLGSCHVLLCSVARAGGGGDLLTKPWTWRPPTTAGPPGAGTPGSVSSSAAAGVGGSLEGSPEEGRPCCGLG